MRNKVRAAWCIAIVNALFGVITSPGVAQLQAGNAHVPNAALTASRWPAFWIASPNAPAQSAGVFYFRKEISPTVSPEHFWVHVSADNRFVLHVNGRYAAEGPARGHGWMATVQLPEGIAGSLTWAGRSQPLHSGEQTLELP